MMTNLLTKVITQLVLEKSSQKEYGVSVINMPDFDYAVFSERIVLSDRKVELYFLGFSEEKISEIRETVNDRNNMDIYFDVERAEESRNSGDENTFRVLVIKRQDTEKLSSLRWFPEITLKDVYKQSCKFAIHTLRDSNQVVTDLISAIGRKSIREILGFERVLEYLNCLLLSTPEDLPNTMKSQFFRLGLCSDMALDQGRCSIDTFVKIIRHNHDVVERLSNLEQSERQCLANYSVQQDTDREIPNLILKYYRTKDIYLLSKMDIALVEQCLKAAKSKTGSTDNPNKSKSKKQTMSSTTAASQFVFDGSTDLIDEAIEKIATKIDETQKPNKREKVDVVVDDIKIQVLREPITEKIADTILNQETVFGQIIYADVQSPAEAVENINKYNSTTFGEAEINRVIECLNNVTEFIDGGQSITRYLKEFLEVRNEISQYSKRLQDIPMFAILANISTFSKYLNAYKKLLDAIDEDFRKIWDIAPSDAKDIVSTIMGMDYVYVIGDEACHAMPTPLNPLYLWKYIRLSEEIIDGKGVDGNEESSLTEADKDFIIRKSESIPDPLAVTLIPAFVRPQGAIHLPLAGRIGIMPVYSTKRQIDQDEAGIEAIQQSIIRYLCLYPHAGMMLKLSIVDPPSVESIASMLKGLNTVREFDIEGINISIYRTKVSTSDWLSIDDKSFNEGIFGRVRSHSGLKLGFSVNNELLSYVEILNMIEQEQHIMIIFDPNEVKVSRAQNNNNVHIHPLCVPKIYSYNPVSNKVEIRPSNEGDIFSTYSSIIEKLNEQPSSFSHTSTFFKTPLERMTYETMLKKADWLMILDQSLKSWDISLKSASEKLFYKEDSYRSVGIYSSNCKKFIRGCRNLIYKLGNFIPTEKGIKDIIECIRDLNNDGLLSMISHNSNRIFEEKHGKGSLGLAIAAIQYKTERPQSLLISLDTQLAKEWLSEREDGVMPDLIGINFDDNNCSDVTVDVIEVKTYNNSPNSFVLKDGFISGHAVDQVFVLEDLIKEIFGVTEKITTISRREILREQVFESLFQDNQLSKQAKQDLSKRLNELFSGHYNIKVNKQISYVDFEHQDVTSEEFYTEYDNFNKIRLVTIGQSLIQSVITSQMIEILPKRILEYSPETLIIGDIEDHPEITNVIGSEDITESRDITESKSEIKSDAISTQTIESNNLLEMEDATQDGQASIRNEEEIIENCRRLDKVFSSFDIQVKTISTDLVLETARFTRYKVALKPGTTLKQIQNRAEDIAIQMAANGKIRIEHIKGTSLIAIDIPHAKPAKPIMLLDYLNKLNGGHGHLDILVGQDAENQIIIKDIADMPHLLVAGTTGSGKTVFLHSILLSLMYQYGPQEIEFLIIDPKQTDFTFFQDLPNLYGHDVITDCAQALEKIQQINDEDKVNRTNILKESKCKDILSFNAKFPEKKMKRLVVIIDEYADLIGEADRNGSRKEFEDILNMLAQRVRNLGIHLIVATQRPSAKIVTGNIKANIPCRVSFRLASHTDSMTILDESGAEDLLGKGDMIIKTESSQDRLQGLYVTEEEIQDFVSDYLNKSPRSNSAK